MDENKEELEKEVTETSEAQATQEVEKDSEEYYDELDYKSKEKAEATKAKIRAIIREIIDWVVCFVIAYVIYLLINYFFVSFPGVKQESMYPTIKDGERVMAVRTWMTGDFNYGDIVTFEAPIDNVFYIKADGDNPVAQYENKEGLTLFLYNFLDVGKVNYIKRVIGLPGDHIVISDGKVYRNDELLTEDYLREIFTTEQEQEYSDVIVPEGSIYVMGDNREKSKDSRSFGCVPVERVNGKVLCRVWPLNKLGKIDKAK